MAGYEFEGVSSIDALALRALPEKAMIARIAAEVRAGEWETKRQWRISKAEAMAIIRAISTQWGAKGRLADALRTEVRRQDRKRDENRANHVGEDGRYYDAVGASELSTPRDRRLALANKRLKGFWRQLAKEHKSNSPYLMSPKLGSDITLALARPSFIDRPDGGFSYEHKVCYLVYRITGRESIHAVRLIGKPTSVEKAIERLKPAAVKRAEGKYEWAVKVDWENEAWLVSPPGKGWKTYPFKVGGKKKV